MKLHLLLCNSNILFSCVLVGRMMSTLAVCAADSQPEFCPICGSKVIPFQQVQDDPSKPSKNLAVWNHGPGWNYNTGPFVEQGCLICPKDFYAYSIASHSWTLYLLDRNAFQLRLDKSIHDFPVPESRHLLGPVPYMQTIKDNLVEELVGYTFRGVIEEWIETLKGYARDHEIDLLVQINNPELKPPASVEIRAKKSYTVSGANRGQR